MSGDRRDGRIAALQSLYQLDVRGQLDAPVPTDLVAQTLSVVAVEQSTGLVARQFADEIVNGVLARRDKVDSLIEEASRNWRIARMNIIDRNALRIAAFEFLDYPDRPAAVIINEAVELAKTFGEQRSGAFVNGILDRLEGLARR